MPLAVLAKKVTDKKVLQLKRISRKQSARWQHLSRLKAVPSSLLSY